MNGSNERPPDDDRRPTHEVGAPLGLEDTAAPRPPLPSEARTLAAPLDAATAPGRSAADTTVAPVDDERSAADTNIDPLVSGVAPTPSTKIGRFTILERIGEGGMGIVYAAYDDQLDRKVALKVLRGDTRHHDPQASERMLREAQAMARVSHPNIVTVHEVNTHAGQVFIAMEFVRGQNLHAWLKSEPRSWREVVATMVQAGRGLAAAHAAGLIHRDFKPANMLVAEDDAVKVVDFGLARTIGMADAPTEDITANLRASVSARLDLHLTRTGAVIGTPAYMAPEQHLGEPATEKSDQFSFCVTLYEALYRQYPFDSTSLPALVFSITHGDIKEPAAGTQVPAALMQLVARGLAVDPSHRHSSMLALLDGLERALERRRVPWLLTVAIAGVVGAGGFVAATVQRSSEDVCAAAANELVGLWDEGAAEEARAGVLKTAVPYAEDTWARVQPRLDEYARDLVAMRVEACRAHEEGRHSTHLFDLRTVCLDERHSSLETFVAILKHADVDVVRNAAAGAASLPQIAACGDTKALNEDVPPPDDPRLAEQVHHARQLLAQAQTHELAGQVPQGLALTDEVLAQSLPYPPLLAELALSRGGLLSEAGRYGEAEAALTDALKTALSTGHDLVAAAASTKRGFLRAARLLQPREVLAEAPLVEGMVARVEGYSEGKRYRGDHLNNLGIAHAVAGEHHLAREYFMQSLDARRAALGGDHPEVVYALGNLGLSLAQSNEAVTAVARLSEAVTAAEEVLGPKHPHVAALVINLGLAYAKLGRHRDATKAFERGVALQTELVGPNTPDLHFPLEALGELAVHRRRFQQAGEYYQRALQVLQTGDGTYDPSAIWALRGLGDTARGSGDAARAMEYYQQALALAEKANGVDSPQVAYFLDSIGGAHFLTGDHERALELYERALAIRKAKLPPSATELGDSYTWFGEVYGKQRRYDEALDSLERARTIYEANMPAESRPIAEVLRQIGELELERGRVPQAIAHLQRAVAIYATISDADLPSLALARFGLARALAAQGGADAEARALAEDARTTLRGLGESFAPEVAAIDTWLKSQG